MQSRGRVEVVVVGEGRNVGVGVKNGGEGEWERGKVGERLLTSPIISH